MANSFNKTTINFWLDTFLLVVFLVLCWCTVVLRYVFPVAIQAKGWSIWGLDYLAWTDIQFITLCVLTAGILLHLMMHWTWICGVVENWNRKRRGTTATKGDTGVRTIWGVGMLIVLLNIVGFAVAAAALSIQSPTP